MRKPMLVARARKAASEASPRRLREGSATACRVMGISCGSGMPGGWMAWEFSTGSNRGEDWRGGGVRSSLPGFLDFLGMVDSGDTPASSHYGESAGCVCDG